MEANFWHERWKNNQIGFHEGAPNSLLTAHFAALGVTAGARIFVPLCGKTNDMAWLRAQGYRVVGAELSRMAVEQFFAEHSLTPAVTSAGKLDRFDSEGIEVFVGDLFDLDETTLGPVDAIYDRAALVALPEPMRKSYASHLLALTDAAPQLLITFEYDQTLAAPPPHSVTDAEVHRHYDAAYRIEQVEERDVPGGLKGLCPARESAWLLRSR